MVFERLVADILNRALGDYIANLDSSQLNVGIWAGDVKLTKLAVKDTALDGLDLPVSLRFGSVDSLTLSIPWKALYQSPTTVVVDGVYILVVPNKGIRYDEEKEKKNQQEAKKTTLARLEEARKEKRNPKQPTADTFTEKMIANIVKNLQVTVRNIHVRFEDRYTNRDRQFAAGITMNELQFQTTDSNWMPKVIADAVTLFHKLVELKDLAVYWQSPAKKMLCDLTDSEQLHDALKGLIANDKRQFAELGYVLKPMTVDSRLVLNLKPETDGSNWTTPKIDLTAGVPQLGLSIGRLQYQDVLLFAEGQERFQLAGKYLKYRPDLLQYKGHYSEWWKFAYTCILEERVRRRRKNWSWPRIKKHRALVKQYKAAWIEKQVQQTPDKETLKLIEDAEKQLDVFNLNVARQQAELEIDRQGLTRAEDQPKGWTAWAKSWWGGGGSGGGGPANKEQGGGSLADQLSQEMTPDEKKKLFDAIDYQENMPPSSYPAHFVENRVRVALDRLAIDVDGALDFNLDKLALALDQRPSARATWMTASIDGVKMVGADGKDVLRMVDPTTRLVHFELDVNPISDAYDQSVRLAIAPVRMHYEAAAINAALVAFQPPESVRLNQLAAAAISRYEEKEEEFTATGLAHAVSLKSRLEVDIRIEPAQVVVCENGVYAEDRPTLLLQLGQLSVATQRHDKDGDDMMDKVYDRFAVRLTRFGAIFGATGAECRRALDDPLSQLHLLEPAALDVKIDKCSVDDLRLPKIKVSGALPDVVLSVSDERFVKLLKLLLSIPQPPAPAPEEKESLVKDEKDKKDAEKRRLRDAAKIHTILETNEVEIADDQEDKEQKEEEEAVEEEEEKKQTGTQQQMIMAQVNLELGKIGLVVSRAKGDQTEVFLRLLISHLHCAVQMREADMHVMAGLGAISCEMPTFRALTQHRPHLYVLDASGRVEVAEQEQLLKLDYRLAKAPNDPLVAQSKNEAIQTVRLQVARLHVVAHQESLLALRSWAEQIQADVEAVKTAQQSRATELETAVETQARRLGRHLAESVRSLTSVITKGNAADSSLAEQRRLRKLGEAQKQLEDEVQLDMRLEAHVDDLGLSLGGDRAGGVLLRSHLQALNVEMEQRATRMDVVVKLGALSATHPKPDVLHQDVVYVKSLDDKTANVITLRFRQWNRTDEQRANMRVDQVDMDVNLRILQIRVTFLNLWLSRLLVWSQPFQADAHRAQAAVQEAAAAAAERAKQRLVERAPRLALDIELESPCIVVPRSSTSPNVLVLDLGTLRVNNTFQLEKETMTVERLRVELSNMHVSAALTIEADGGDAANTALAHRRRLLIESHAVLEPVSFVLHVDRNLSFAAGDKRQPEIGVDIRIARLQVSLRQDDYATLMLTLSGNMAETDEDAAVLDSTQPQIAAAAAGGADRQGDAGVEPPLPQKTSDKADKEKASSTQQQQQQQQQQGGSAVRMSVLAKLDAVAIVLFDADGTSKFASLSLTELATTTEMREDGALSLAAQLGAFTMHDHREHRTKIVELMERRDGAEAGELLQLKFTQDAQQNKNVRLRVQQFYICLCPEFLGSLNAFLAIPEQPETATAATKATTKAAAVKGKSNEPAEKKTGAKSPPPTSAVAAGTGGTLTLDAELQGMEVLLVENALEPESTRALVLSFNADARAQPISATSSRIDGGLRALRVYSTYYARARRDEITYEVLRSVDFIVVATIDPAFGAQHVDLTAGVLHVRVTPTIVRLLGALQRQFTDAAQTAAAAHTEARARPDKTAAGLPRFPGYFEQYPIDYRTTHFLRPAEDSVEVDETAIVVGSKWVAVTAQEMVEDLATESDEESVMTKEAIVVATRRSLQQLRFRLESLSLRLEAGEQTLRPLIHLQTALNVSVFDWTGAMHVDGVLSLQASYYNDRLSAWEPLIEPVPIVRQTTDGQSSALPNVVEPVGYGAWRIRLIVNMRPARHHNGEWQPAQTLARLESTELLNLTVTTTLLRLLGRLSETFAHTEAAANQAARVVRLPGSPANFVLANRTGVDVEVQDSTELQVVGEKRQAPHADYLELAPASERGRSATPTVMTTGIGATLAVKLLGVQRHTDVARVGRRVLRLPRQSPLTGAAWRLVVDTRLEDGRRLITLRSPVQVVNHLATPVEVLARHEQRIDSCGYAAPRALGGQPLPLPLPLVYTHTHQLHFRPLKPDCELSNECLVWHQTATLKNGRQLFRADLEEDDATATKAVYFEAQVVTESVGKDDETIYTIHLFPALVLHNQLPCALELTDDERNENQLQTLDAGAERTLNTIPNRRLIIRIDHNERKYTYRGALTAKQFEEPGDEPLALPFECDDTGTRILLGANISTTHGVRRLELFAPFWLINNTPQMIAFKLDSAADLIQEPNDEIGPQLVPYATANTKAKKKGRVQLVSYSDWSEPFPLDAGGQRFATACKGRDGRKYDLSVSVEFAGNSRTYVIRVSPFYVVVNRCPVPIEIREDGVEDTVWRRIEASGGRVEVYPADWNTIRKFIAVRLAEAPSTQTLAFPITENASDLVVTTEDDHAALVVNVAVCESSSHVEVSPFTEGVSPVLVINTLPFPVRIGQKGERKMTLEPGTRRHLAWSNLRATPAELQNVELEAGEDRKTVALNTTHRGQVRPNKNGRFYYYGCFLDGRQRTLLLDADVDVVSAAVGTYEEGAPASLSASLSLNSFGLSVVDNETSAGELLYASITPSDIVWEERKARGGRWRLLATKHIDELETFYQECERAQRTWTGGYQPMLSAKGDWAVSMETMIIKKGMKGQKTKIRRSFNTGVSVVYSAAGKFTSLRAKISHIQIDDQMPGCVFPCILSAVPPPRSVVVDHEPKAVVDFLLVQRQHSSASSPTSAVVEYELMQVLVQELSIQADKALLFALLGVVSPPDTTSALDRPLYDRASFELDLKRAKNSSRSLAPADGEEDAARVDQASGAPKVYYSMLHISPLMIHLSFSQGGFSRAQAQKKQDNQGGGNFITNTLPVFEFAEVLMKSVGVTLTEIQDVVFKLPFFERRGVFYSSVELSSNIQSHYQSAAIKQLYVLVFGLDIIGNPFGLVRDLSAGVEDLFYQPFQGAIADPDEVLSGMATGVAIGVSSFVSHAVSGAAGAVGRITGTVGKTMAVLTFDDDYQRKRQEELNRRPQSVGEGMAKGLMGFGRSLVAGVTGVVRNPVQGLREDGAKGLVKGLGKGLVGVVTRPISGAVDLASHTLDTVKTVAGPASRQYRRIRLPRVLGADGVVRPYNEHAAVGQQVLADTDQGEHAAADTYIDYTFVSNQQVLLATDRQLILSKRSDVTGTWGASWQVLYTDVDKLTDTATGIKVEMRNEAAAQRRTNILSPTGSSGSGGPDRLIAFARASERFVARVQQAHAAANRTNSNDAE